MQKKEPPYRKKDVGVLEVQYTRCIYGERCGILLALIQASTVNHFVPRAITHQISGLQN